MNWSVPRVMFIVILTVAVYLIDVPASVSAQESAVTVGLNIPLTGAYSKQGEDEKRAYTLAIDELNSQGGVLGKQISYMVRDTKTNAKIARKNALELITDHNVVMMTGGSSSAVAIAQSDVCQEHGVVFMAALTHSNATTGHMHRGKWSTFQKAHRHTFRWYFNAWMTSEALNPYLIQKFNKTATYFYITSDYTWGHTLEESMRRGTELAGCDTLGTVLSPLGKKDYHNELQMAAAANPDVLVLVLFGQDMIMALKQADEMGLKTKMHIVVPLMELNMARGAGIKAIEGVISTKNWYWGLKDNYPGSKKFVNLFMEKYEKAPGSSAAAAWVAIHEWASAAERAGSFSSDAVIQALEGHTFTLLKDQEKWKSWDHQAISSVFIVQGKSPGESQGPWDLLKILKEIPGNEVVRNREQNPVTLEKLPSES